MKIIDAHVHLYPEPDLEKEVNVSKENLNLLLSNLSKKIVTQNISEAVVYVLDEKILNQELDTPNNLIISSVVGIKNTDYMEDLIKIVKKKIKIVKILPYDQGITRDMYPKVLEIAEFLEEKQMVMTICSTYGSKLLFDTNGIELATFLKKKVDIPIILAHGGGSKVFDAMSIMADYDNIFLDFSFSLKFWWGSSVIKDYAFALKKLNFTRSFYGSDYPYVSFNESYEFFKKFTEKYHIPNDDIEKLLYDNFNQFKLRFL